MMMLEVTCAMCGKEKAIPLAADAAISKTTIKEIIETAGWIAQINGDNFDHYCSKKCAS